MINSKLIQQVIDMTPPNATDRRLLDGSKLQILDSVGQLARARKHRWAAFLRQEKSLVIWEEKLDVDALMDAADVLHKKILQLVWSGIPNDAFMTDVEPAEEKQRPLVFLTVINQTIATMITIIIILGLGIRKHPGGLFYAGFIKV